MLGRFTRPDLIFRIIPLIPRVPLADKVSMNRHCSMKNQRMLAEAFKNLDEELNQLYRMASQIFPPHHTSPLRRLLNALASPFRR